MGNPMIHAFILSLLPISELRGGIPYAVANDVPLAEAYLLCVFSNILVIPIVYLFLETVHRTFYKVTIYQRIFDRYVERTRRKAERNVARYGYWGVMLFVAVPLPVTGAYTGTVAAWLLKLNRKRSFWYLALGVVIAGVIVSIATITGLNALQIFLK
ncbi:MAG: small multi-drug export protein [Candidatus Zixiibacteriota bacterium]|nr:MAG: small multi-drug export protein [candidate division Zixibacteria bacterium]